MPDVPQVAESKALLTLTGVTKYFPAPGSVAFGKRRELVRAVDGIDLVVHPGETVCLVGESGCGKSTTGRTIVQLYPATSGSIEFDGIEVTKCSRAEMNMIRRRMQMIFQDPYGSLDPRMSIENSIAEPLIVHNLARGREKKHRVRELLHRVGLNPAMADRYPHEFSGGQRQRVGIARALAVEPEFIVADEPISALDVSIQAQVINLLQDLQSQYNLAYLFITHDLGVVRHIADRVAVMYLGKIVETANCDDLYGRPLHPYTRALLSAVPVADPSVESHRRRIRLTGDVPSATNIPSGCRFRTRCDLTKRLGNPDICSTVEPALESRSGSHLTACHFADIGHEGRDV